MRILSGTLILISACIALVLGVLQIFSSKYEVMDAKADVGDLSDVSGDLASPDQIKKERQAAEKKIGNAGMRSLLIGAAMFGVFLLNVFGGILIFIRRARRVMIVDLLLAIALWIPCLFVGGNLPYGAIGFGALLVGFFTAVLFSKSSGAHAG
jgi:1,4-dihydroxy-2-naphthoate octaprenyltransferase